MNITITIIMILSIIGNIVLLLLIVFYAKNFINVQKRIMDRYAHTLEGNILPSITHDEDNVSMEIITCTSISGGANYYNGMPKELTLSRSILTNGDVIYRRYTQTQDI